MMATQPTPESLRPKRPAVPQLSQEEQLDIQYRSHVESIRNLISQERYNGAERMLMKTLEQFPDHPEVLRLKIEILHKLEQDDLVPDVEDLIHVVTLVRGIEEGGQLPLPI